MFFTYGTKYFTKFLGYYGQVEPCINCGKNYSPAFVQSKKWGHFDYIPLIPMGKKILKMCPICGNAVELSTEQAKAYMNLRNDNQKIELYFRHVLSNKPQGMLSVDNSYELWCKDFNMGQEFLVFNGLTKDDVKDIKKQRGQKNLAVIDYN